MSCSFQKYKVPKDVKKEAELGLKMKANGYNGGTQTGWNRAKQLKRCDYVSIITLRKMSAWYARHGPDAANGGTSYPGYQKWKKDGSPVEMVPGMKNKYRGAVAYLIWGGQSAYKWLKEHEDDIQKHKSNKCDTGSYDDQFRCGKLQQK